MSDPHPACRWYRFSLAAAILAASAAPLSAQDRDSSSTRFDLR